ncbi:hypothetical protein C8Q74DRAFT_1233059 [Fomes fomentarius]|nr:hypothetical protein C8Q74DRAFT_1233059 [Fomes fomentarius]
MYFATLFKLAVTVAFVSAVSASPSSLEARQSCAVACIPGSPAQCIRCLGTSCAGVVTSPGTAGAVSTSHVLLSHPHVVLDLWYSPQACLRDSCLNKSCRSDADCDASDCPDETVTFGANVVNLSARCVRTITAASLKYLFNVKAC